MTVYAEFEGRIAAALDALEREGRLPQGLPRAGIEAMPPRDPTHGDIASNAALVLAKPAGLKPRAIAEMLAEKLKGDDVVRIDIAGPGFLNLTLDPAVWRRVVAAVLAAGPGYGRGTVGAGEKVDLEYVSANPTGPMHVGHCRGAVFGDALANVLAFVGYDVTREYYINDAGAQVDVLARSAYLRYREALGDDIGAIPPGLYPGDYLVPVGAALASKYGRDLLQMPDDQWLPIAREAAIAAMLEQIKTDLDALNIHHDVFFSERSLTGAGEDQIAAAIDDLRTRGLVYEGRLPKPKGHDDVEWEDREQTLFRSTGFGDDMDRALKKSDGGYTYFAADVAYHRNKIRRGFRHLINVFGADHVGYIPRVRAVVTALSDGAVDLDIKVCQLVRLFRAGEPVKMSKRAGTFVTLRDVVDEVGRDPVRFMMLYRKNDAPLDFDLAKVIEQSKDNPVFYVQYAHARARSVFRNAAEAMPGFEPEAAAAKADLALLSDAGEVDLMRKLAFFPVVVEGAARAHEPHRLAFYLYDLASNFHAQWTRGNDSPHLRFIQTGDGALTAARLALIKASAQVIATGLGLLGVDAPDEMR